MTGVVVDPGEEGSLSWYLASHVLERGDILVGVQRNHSIVVVGRGDHHSWIHAWLNGVKW